VNRYFLLLTLTLIMTLISHKISLAEPPVAWPAPEWEVASPQSQGVSGEELTRVHNWLRDNGSKTGIVVRHGKIIGEWYYGDAKPDSQYLVYSTTKSFSATAAGIAIAEGKLSLDTKLGDLIPDVAPPEKREVTVRQILSMTTGVHNDPTIRDRPDMFTYALTKAPMDFKPGEKWEYNNTGNCLLGPMIRKATGQDIDEYLDAKVFKPIGIKKSDWHWDRQEGHPLPFSGLHITARALARFGLMTLREGKWQDQQLVPAAWVKQAAAPSQSMTPNYGFLWWNNSTGAYPDVPKDAFAAMGKFDNSMLIVPSSDLIVLRQIGADPKPDRKINLPELFRLAVHAIE
jgi:CubicO group peptidase (beta-lactamase class C family)